MENEPLKLYTHVMIDIHGENIRFGTDQNFHIGISLFDFIEHMTSHPYFSQKIEGKFQELLKDMPAGQMIELQNTYRALIDAAAEAEDKEHYDPAVMDYMARYKCIAGLGIIFDQSGMPWFDYLITEFEDCLYLELRELILRKCKIKKCKNCGRYFVPKKSNIDYCQRIYTEDGKTCAQVGYAQTFAKSVKSDELLLAYTRAYKAHYARMSKPRKKAANMSREAFDAWYAEAKQKLDQARNGTLDSEIFMRWLKE